MPTAHVSLGARDVLRRARRVGGELHGVDGGSAVHVEASRRESGAARARQLVHAHLRGAAVNMLELAARIGVEGFLHCEELNKLIELAVNRDVLEVGSFRGLSAWGMG